MASIKLIRKRLIMVLLTMSLICSLHGQGFGLYVGIGGATNKMSDLKYYQKILLDNFPVEGKMISIFPPYLTGSIGIFKNMTDYLRLGIEYTLLSTGARAYYSDYSGYRDAKQIIKAHQLGVIANYILVDGKRFDISAFGSLSASYSILDLSEYIYANSLYFGSYYDFYNIRYRSLSPQIGAGLEFLTHLGNYDFGLDAGYCADLAGELTNKDNPDYKLTDPNDPDSVLITDWSGFRIRLKVIINLN